MNNQNKLSISDIIPDVNSTLGNKLIFMSAKELSDKKDKVYTNITIALKDKNYKNVDVRIYNKMADIDNLKSLVKHDEISLIDPTISIWELYNKETKNTYTGATIFASGIELDESKGVLTYDIS